MTSDLDNDSAKITLLAADRSQWHLDWFETALAVLEDCGEPVATPGVDWIGEDPLLIRKGTWAEAVAVIRGMAALPREHDEETSARRRLEDMFVRDGAGWDDAEVVETCRALRGCNEPMLFDRLGMPRLSYAEAARSLTRVREYSGYLPYSDAEAQATLDVIADAYNMTPEVILNSVLSDLYWGSESARHYLGIRDGQPAREFIPDELREVVEG